MFTAEAEVRWLNHVESRLVRRARTAVLPAQPVGVQGEEPAEVAR